MIISRNKQDYIPVYCEKHLQAHDFQMFKYAKGIQANFKLNKKSFSNMIKKNYNIEKMKKEAMILNKESLE